MVKVNMANMNTLFRKGYLLAGMMMAANIFVVNEMKAMENMETKEDESILNSNRRQTELQKNEEVYNEIIKIPVDEKKEKKSGEKGSLDKVLSLEDTINLVGGLALSGANNYFKWWNYDSGTYQEFGCIGWRSKRLLNDIFQFEVNLNGVRGTGWAFLYILDLFITKPKGEKTIKVEIKDEGTSKKTSTNFTKYIFNCSRGFVSMPLTLHFSNFSISISLDSIIWSIIGMILDKKDGKNLEEIKIKEEEDLKELEGKEKDMIIDDKNEFTLLDKDQPKEIKKEEDNKKENEKTEEEKITFDNLNTN